MSFDWREYKNLAQWLHDNAAVPNCSAEACYRTAISRAYYAAFQCAMDFAVEKENFPESGSGDDHGRLLAHFKKKGGARGRIYLSLDRLRDNRLQADYEGELTTGDPRKTSELSMSEAKKLFDTLDKLRST